MHIPAICRLALPLLVFAAFGTPALATGAAWLGAADCRIAPLNFPPPGEASWTGGCVGGYASGSGIIVWTTPIGGKVTLEATLVRGEVSGEAVLKLPGYTYEGTVQGGAPHGKGYFQHEGRGWYEGEFVRGLPHGKGTYVKLDRSRYTGEWVQGMRHGWGEASFATGGSYTGNWKGDAFNGQGAIVYAGAGHKYEGAFQDGRVAGLPKAQVEEGRYALKGNVSGTDMSIDRITAVLPLNARWNELTPAQKNTFRENYPALEAGDEPPFPVKGIGPLFDKISRVNQNHATGQGDITVHVMVGKDGRPLSVTAYGAQSATFVRAVSTLFMLDYYKPALCRGEPCGMVFPGNFRFSVSD